MRRSVLVVSVLMVLVGCGGNGSGGTAPGGGGGGGGPLVHASRVTATSGLAFDPAAVSIPAGDTIYFTFQSVIHNVTFTTAGSPGNVGDTHDATVKRVFSTAGTYDYKCTIHQGMTGSITVTP